MARGYRQVQSGDYLYRGSRGGTQYEYRVLHLVFDGDADEPVQVAVKEVQQGTIANPGSPQHPQVRYWSLAQIDVDAMPAHRGYVHQGMYPVTNADGRKVKSASFDRMTREARKRRAAQG